MKKRRSNGFGTLVSKGEGKPYLARWCYEGHIYTKSTGETDRDKALKALEKLTRPFREDTKIEVLRSLEAKVKSAEDLKREAKTMKIGDMSKAFTSSLAAKDIEESTLSMYVNYIDCLAKWLKEHTKCKTVREVKAVDAENYLKEIADKNGAATYNIKLVFYIRLWNVLKDEAGVNENIWSGFKKMKVSKSSGRRPLTKEQIFKILEKSRSQPELLLLFALGIYTGMRVGDCAELMWSQVNLGKLLISIVPRKTKRHMTAPIEIPLHPSLAKLLEEWWPKRDENGGYVCEMNARDYKCGRLCKTVRRLFRECGIKTSSDEGNGKKKYLAGFHSLRHTFVSWAIDNGMNPLLVQRIVGHSTIAMSDHYYHSNGKVIREGISQLPDVIGCTRETSGSILPCKSMSISPEGLKILESLYDSRIDSSLDDVVKRLAGMAAKQIAVSEVA